MTNIQPAALGVLLIRDYDNIGEVYIESAITPDEFYYDNNG